MLFQGWTGFVDGVFEAKESVAMISIKQAVGQHDSAAVPGSAIYISTLDTFCQFVGRQKTCPTGDLLHVQGTIDEESLNGVRDWKLR